MIVTVSLLYRVVHIILYLADGDGANISQDEKCGICEIIQTCYVYLYTPLSLSSIYFIARKATNFSKNMSRNIIVQ